MYELLAKDEGVVEYVMRVLEWVKGKVYHTFYEVPYVGDILDKIPVWAYGVIIVVLFAVTAFITYHTIVSIKVFMHRQIANSVVGDAMEKRRTLVYADRLAKEGDYIQASDIYFSVGEKARAAKLLEKGNYLDKAGKMYEKMGDLDRAIELYEKAGENAWLADALRQKGEFAKAGELMMRLGKKLMAAECFVKANQHKKAAELFASSGNLSSAAECYEKAGELQMAAKMYEQSFIEGTSGQEMPPPDVKAKLDNMITKAAEYYGKTGDHLKAAGTYARVKQFMKAGEAALRGGDSKRAAEYFKEGKEYEKAAEIFRRSGDKAGAADILAQKFIESHDYAQAGRLFLEAGSFLKAADFLTQGGELLLAADAFMQGGEYVSAGELYEESGEKQKAAEAYEKADNLHRAAQLYADAGELPRASTLYEQAGEYMKAAGLFGQMGQKDRELSALQKVQPQDPDYNEAVAMLAEIFKEKGNLKLAMEKYMQALGGAEPNQFNLGLCYGLAGVYEAEGSYGKALEIYQKIQLVDFGFREVGLRIKECEGLLANAPGTTEPTRPDAAARAAQEPQPQSGDTQTQQDAAKRYAIVKEIGRGGMGVVYQGKDKHLNRIIAIKVLPRHISENPKMVKRFAAEARSAAQLTHSNIVTLYDFQQAGGRSFITMEYVDGITLKKLMGMVDKLPIVKALKIIYQCCQGLDYAHKKGIIHRDIKPSNIMINKQNVVKIMDFGLAKVAGEETLTDAGSLSGTVMYMSPEQLLGEKLDKTTDIYALGLVFYELVTGAHPFPGGDVAYHHIHTKPKPPQELRPEIPGNLNDIILKCIEKDRAGRFQSSAQLALSLREVPLK